MRALALLLIAGVALAEKDAPPPRDLQALRTEVERVRRQLRSLKTTDVEVVLDALLELQKRLATLEQVLSDLPPRIEQLAARDDIQELLDQLTALKDDMATRDELKKYQRKANEKQVKNRFAGELEVEANYLRARKTRLHQLARDLGALALAAPQSRPLIAELGAAAGLFDANHAQVRPHFTVRLYWENNRFLDEGDTFLFANAMPELNVYVLQDDLERWLRPRDMADPRERAALVFKKAAAGLQTSRWGLSAGVLQFTHGSGFFVNPTNPFTPKDPLDPRDEVDGVPAVQLDWTALAMESISLSLKAAGVLRNVRNDFFDQRRNSPEVATFGLAKLVTDYFTFTGVGMYQSPNAWGLHSPSYGGILSLTPFGVTLSAEALWTESPTKELWLPQVVASFEAFFAGLMQNGTTVVAEFYLNRHNPVDAPGAQAQIADAVLHRQTWLAADRLLRPLGRQRYVTLYLEPGLTEKLRANVSGLYCLDDNGFLTRAGFDYQFLSTTVHAYGGLTWGEKSSEFRNHVLEAFASLVWTAAF